MEFRQLKYFIAIVDQGSLTRAVNVLHIAQPALSHQIAQLEDDLGVKLLHRSGQGMTPTEAGRRFYRHARAILRQIDDARAAVAPDSPQLVGSVSLGMSPGIAGLLALPLLSTLRSEHPGIRLQLAEELTTTLAEQLERGRFDLSILFDDGQLGRFDVLPLVEERLLFVASPDWFASGSTPASISIDDALAQPLLLPSPGVGVRPRIDKLIARAQHAPQDVTLVDSLGISRAMLLAGLVGTIQCSSPYAPELIEGSLIGLPFSDIDPTRTVCACASREVPMSEAARTVRATLSRIVRDVIGAYAWPAATALDASLNNAP